MAAPAFGTAGTQLQGSASTMNVDVPDSVAAGDIIVVTAFIDTSTVTVTGLPADFTQAPDSPVFVDTGGVGGTHRMYVMWKRATGSDSTAGTYDFTLSGSTYRNAQAIRYTGANSSGDPWDVTNSAQGGAVNDTVTPAVSDTSTVADTLLVWAGTNWSGGTWTPPTGFTERRDTGDGVCTVADLAQAAAGATGSITGTCTGNDKRGAWLGALEPQTAVAESAAYSVVRLPGRIGPDGKIFTPGQRFDNNGALAAVTGTVAETQDNQTSTATGVLGYTGTAAKTQDNQTSTASGVLGYSGAVAETQDNQTSSASGILGYSGTVAETQDNQTSTASGNVAGGGEVSGTLAETQDAQTASATGQLGYSGSAARTQANQTVSAAGWITITGTVARTQDSQTSTASGALSTSGSVAVTQANQTAAASGSVPIIGTAARTQGNQTSSASGFIGQFATPYIRIYSVAADPRTLEVRAQTRTADIPVDPREFGVLADNRTNQVPADPRTLVVPGDEA